MTVITVSKPLSDKSTGSTFATCAAIVANGERRTTRRRHSEFLELQAKVNTHCPGLKEVLPPFPPKMAFW